MYPTAPIAFNHRGQTLKFAREVETPPMETLHKCSQPIASNHLIELVDRVMERHPHKGKSRFPQAILLASSRSATSQLKPALAEDSKPPDDGPEGVCGLQPGQSAPKTGLDSGAGAASNRGFFQSKKGGWGPVTNWRFAPSLYDAESRVPPRDSPRFAGGRKPRSRYWAIPALSVYQNRDFRQG